jgi:tetratricopeptide (TPR) repeat protein
MNDWQTLYTKATQAYQRGNLEIAEQAINQAIIKAKKADNGHQYLSSSLNMQAFIQSARGDLDAALNSMNKAIKISYELSKEPTEQIATLLFNQGLLLQQAGQTVKAESVLQQSIDSYLLLNSIGKGNIWQAELARAQIRQNTAPEQAISDLASALMGYPHYSGFTRQADKKTQIALSQLKGKIEFNQQYYQQAITTLEQARSNFSENDDIPQQLVILDLLARSYSKLDKLEQSSTIHELALAIRSQQVTSMATVMQLNELALQQQQQKNYHKASQFYQQAINTLQQINSSDSIEQALLLGNYGSLKLMQKDNKSALSLFEQSYQLHQKLNLQPMEASKIAGYLGSIYYNRHQYPKAELAFSQALAWLDRAPKSDPKSILIALENMQALYISWNKDNKARPYQKRIKTLKKKITKKS